MTCAENQVLVYYHPLSWFFIESLSLSFIHSFISGMHRYGCVSPNVDINLQSGRFWATSTASFRERLIDFTFCCVVFIHVVRGRPGGLLQFSMGEAVKICLASDSSDIRAVWLNRERCRAWTVAERCGCSVFRLPSSSVIVLFSFVEQQLYDFTAACQDLNLLSVLLCVCICSGLKLVRSLKLLLTW